MILFAYRKDQNVLFRQNELSLYYCFGSTPKSDRIFLFGRKTDIETGQTILRNINFKEN